MAPAGFSKAEGECGRWHPPERKEEKAAPAGFSKCQLKKTHDLKAENYVLFGELSEDLSPGGSLSDSSEELLWRGEGGPGSMGVSATKTRWSELQKMTVN